MTINASQKMLVNRNIYANALFKRPDSLSDLLPYDEFYSEDGIFILKDGSLGIVYELDLFEHEPLTEKQIVKTIKSLKPWFNLPENCTLQVIHEQARVSPRDKQITDLEATYPNAHPVSKFLFEKKIGDLKNRCGDDSATPVFRRTTYLAIRYFPAKKKPKKIFDFMRKSESTLFHEMKDFIEETRTLSSIAKDIESNSDVRLVRLDASALLDSLRRFFNPETYFKRSFATYNPKISLAKQAIYNSPVLDHEGITREGQTTRTLSLLTAPLIAYPGGMAYFTKLEFPYRISLNFSFPKKANIKRFFDIKEFFLQNTPSARSRVQREEILDVQEKLAKDDRCLQMTFNVTVDGENEQEIDERVRSVCNIFNNQLDCEAIVEDHIGLASCINGLPLCYTPDSDHSSKRYIRILRSDALNFLPIFDSCRGMRDPVTFHLSREGNLAPFTLLNNPINSHTVVLADSGSGKSAFVADWLQSVKRLSSSKDEPLVFIIDKKCSYKALARFYDGDITIFDRDKDVPFSPFRGIYDNEKIAFLTNLMMSAIALTSPSFNLESEHQTALSKALQLAYEKKCQRTGLIYRDGKLEQAEDGGDVELTMEEFIAELAALNDGSKTVRAAVEPLLAKLKPFYGDGIYARFFANSPRPLEKSSSLYIYDLDSLDSDPTLQTLMTMAVIEEIRRVISLPTNKGRTGFIVLEEFAMLGRNNKVFRDFALDFSETMRKRGVWLITLTPRPQNYFELVTGQAFWSVAENYVFLQMNPDNIEYVVNKSSIFDSATAEIARSLTTIKDSHADFLFINKKKDIQQVLTYRQTPYDRWMSPTNAQDERLSDEAAAKFEDKWSALDFLVKNSENKSTKE